MMEAIITAATVAAMYIGLAHTQGGQYVYNADMQNGTVTVMNVYEKQDKYLSQKLQYRFLYDDQKRLASKEALKWNALKRAYVPAYRLSFAYDSDGYTVALSRWDEKAQAYGHDEMKTQYSLLTGEVTGVSTFRWDDDTDSYLLASSVVVMDQTPERLLAQAVTGSDASDADRQ